jgi:hypothetical protein
MEKSYLTSKKDWSKVPHHPQCCCDKCAPTKEEAQRRVEEFKKLNPSTRRNYGLA